MRRSWHLVAVILLVLATAPGNLAMCAGWKPTAEARMACCTGGAVCPMRAHGGAAASHHGITQAAADSCCAAAERGDAAPSSAYVLAAPIAVLAAVLPALDLRPDWHPSFRAFESPPPARTVARHLLLSVILI